MRTHFHMPSLRVTLPIIGIGLLLLPAARRADSADTRALAQALTFHASFDSATDADFALGNRSLHTATSYRKREDTRPGLDHPDVSLVSAKGRFGGALEFRKKNTRAIFYSAEKNVAFQAGGWSGTVSFWLSLDPDQDLEPGFSDPIQITDEDYNDAAVWVDFSKDERPRHFRLGVFGDLASWNPQNLAPDKNPDFDARLVTVTRPPFGKGKWTHVVVTYRGLGAGGGSAALYLDGKHQGTARDIREPFTWDMSRAAIRLGLNYVGLFDDLAVFNRPLSEEEIRLLYGLDRGVAALR